MNAPDNNLFDDAETKRFIGAVLLASVLGLFALCKTRVLTWWRKPSDTRRLSESLDRIAEVVEKMGNTMEHMNGSIMTLTDNFIVAEAMTRAIADRDPTPMFQCELPSGKCVWTNKALQLLFGRTREQMLSNGWAEAIVPSHQDRVVNGWKYSAVNSDIYNCDYPIEAHGKLINVRAHADFVTDAKGRKIIAIGTVRVMPVLREEEAA